MKKIIILLSFLILLSECSLAAKGHWVKKSGQNIDEFWNDRMECEKYNEYTQTAFSLLPGIAGGPGEPALRGRFNRCMARKGYKWEEFTIK
jgi:hypothetical protein